MANRSGGKTLDFSIVSLLEIRANDNCEVANLGAIQAQAQRCYRYMQAFINNNPEYKAFVQGESTINRTNFINRSMIEVLTATITGVNSPHPQRLKMDEIELIAWFIIQQALNMVQARGDVKSCTVMGSTRKFAAGPMQRLVEMSKTGNLKLFAWCILEVLEPLPEDPTKRQEIFDFFAHKGIELPSGLDKCNGYYKWEDFMNKTQLLDREVLDAEWFCKKPQTGGLVYPRYDETLNIEPNFHIDKQALAAGWRQIFVFEDIGYAEDHPDVILFCEVDSSKESIVVFDELYLVKHGTQEIINAALAKLKDNGLELSDVSGWISDPHALVEWTDRYNHGLPMVGDPDEVGKLGQGNAELYRVKNGIAAVRKFIDDRRIRLTTNIVGLRNELMSYSKRKLPDGTFTDDPEKKNDHGPDALRYGLIHLFPALAFASFGQSTEQQRQADMVAMETITGGIMDKTF